MKPCTCGHSVEEHKDTVRGGVGACSECDCVQYEADEEFDDGDDE